MTQEEKPLPKIVTRCLLDIWGRTERERTAVVQEAADLAGIKAEDGWVLKPDATAFVRNGNSEPEKPDATD